MKTQPLLLLIVCFLVLSLPLAAQIPPARQLIVVLTDNWNTLKGNIYCYQRAHEKWVLQFTNAVVVGGNGLGLGDGLIPLTVTGAPVKHEGDNKSPAGIFSIGTAFGYTDAANARWIRNPYIKATDTLICVDDPHSVHYNMLIDNDTTKSDYKSFEHMHLGKDYYKWGLFINHNSLNVTPGDGSCIFMHIWENNHEGTAGCTAMTETNLLRILHWINAQDHPILVQFPKSAYQKLRKKYRFPAITG